MKCDLHTPNVRAAEIHERHHGIDPLPGAHGITAADVEFRMAGDDHPEDCWFEQAMAERRWER